MKRIIDSVVILDAITVPTLSEAKLIEDFRHGVVDIISIGATGTVKVKVSNSRVMPDFSAASTVTNHWSYVDLKGRDDGGATVVGTVGVATTLETSVSSFAINTDAVRWVAVDAEALSAGSISVLISGATND